MLQRTLGSGWGVLLPGLLITGLMYAIYRRINGGLSF